MKRILSLSLALLWFSFGTLTAQNPNMGGKACSVQKVKLPTNYTEPDQRTYDMVRKGRFSYNIDTETKRLYGWDQTKENPNLRAVVNLYGYTLGSPKRNSKKVEKKDKDGKVTESYTEYWYTGSASGRGTLYVYGASNPFEYKKKPKKESSKKKEVKKEEPKSENQFLSAEVVEELEEQSEMDEDSGLEDSVLPFVTSVSVDKSKNLSGGKARSSSTAYRNFKNNQYPQLQDFRSFFPQLSYNTAMRSLNNMYGFAPTKNLFKLRVIKNEKHPQSKVWNDATAATITLFKSVKFNKGIDKTRQQFLPIIDYYVTQVDRNREDDKKERKLKKAAFENLLNIYYYLDRHDDVIALSSEYLESKRLGRLAKIQKGKSEKMKAHLAFLKMETAHMESDKLVIDENEEIEVLEDDMTTGGN
ncbi:MAG: hypothetical protein HKN16_00025 [Saprospiraceae bacterium]|nr:hypothetical protein [Saprospiraceae bacterium]